MELTDRAHLWLQLWLIILLLFANGVVAVIGHPGWPR